MTGPEHYVEAERLALQAAEHAQRELVDKPQPTESARTQASFVSALADLAQVHATLAHVAAVAEVGEMIGDPPWDTESPTWSSVAVYPPGPHTSDKPPHAIGATPKSEQPGPLYDVVGALMDRRGETFVDVMTSPQARISDARAALAAVARWLGEQGRGELGSRLLREPVPGVTP